MSTPLPPELLPLWHAIQSDPYDKGDSRWTVTQLAGPPQVAVLSERYAKEIETAESEKTVEAVADRVYRLLGSSVHSILERAASYLRLEHKAESRVYTTIGGDRISGQFDLLVNGVLVDYKITTIYSSKGKDEWEAQLNYLAHLLELNGYRVDRLAQVLIFRDWSPSAAKYQRGYPKENVKVLDVVKWPAQMAGASMSATVRTLNEQVKLDDEGLMPCTSSEMWEEPTRWVVRKPGAKRARRLFDTYQEAAKSRRLGESLEMRPGDRKRCTGGPKGRPYCPVAEFCHQNKEYLKRKGQQ